MSDTRRIFKFLIPFRDRVTVMMPKGADLLHIGVQNEGIYAWALCEPANVPEPRSFAVIGTGHPVGEGLDALDHVATVILAGGALVFHVFGDSR
jgi:hypothetical protein